MLDGTGMTHGVLIQVSAHGTDNRLMLETVRANRQRLRGIAVAPLGLPDKAYRDMQDAGVVGLRLNVLFGGGIGLERLEDYGALCRELGWHLQFLVGTRHLPPIATRTRQAAGAVHRRPHGASVGGRRGRGPDFQTLVSLVRDGGWVKLSGAFRVTAEGPPYRDTIPLARALHRSGAGPLRVGLGLAARRHLAAQAHAQRRRPARRAGRLGAGRGRAQAACWSTTRRGCTGFDYCRHARTRCGHPAARIRRRLDGRDKHGHDGR